MRGIDTDFLAAHLIHLDPPHLPTNRAGSVEFQPWHDAGFVVQVITVQLSDGLAQDKVLPAHGTLGFLVYRGQAEKVK